jgi:predicted enzyme related to lactoylglutathione lyase
MCPFAPIIVTITSINPIILFVKDYGVSLGFYRDVLGLKLTSQDEPHEEFATFDVGGTVFAIHGGYEGAAGEGNVALHFAVTDIKEEVERLKSKGVKFTKEVHKMPWGAYQATFVDPDGNEMDMMQHPAGGPIM